MDILVDGFDHTWTKLIEETYFGSCPKSNVRVVDTQTGEWIDDETSGSYQDYVDTGRGQTRDYCRVVDYDPDSDDPDDEQRYIAMMNIQKGLPRISLDALS